ncbi:MAG: UDP-N-acetylmuramoyl-L-alanyl-D-glutamate--2,6-diaminopimelate ligase [Gemmatimonadetes bacterium]|nr:UDP-N-acetylmuramoyl-L-alanyl-D-glutamate--2,6-diaminopimelate ligase [Gemmatimonadota bacterium]
MADRSMPFEDVVRVLRDAELLVEAHGQRSVVVHGVAHDSRAVVAGDVFVAWVGMERDGHEYAADAVRAGAVALVLERRLPALALAQAVVTGGRRAAALVADAVFGSPWSQLALVGVTGTNGKTTTVAILRHVLSALGPAASLGTLGLVGPDGRVRPGTEHLTTPGPADFSRWLRDLADEGVVAVALEASSHALDQRRLDGARFDVVVYTNLTRDHLDYHGTLEAYFAAKAHLVELLKRGGTVVLNAAEPAWARLPLAGRRVVTFAVERDADVRAEAVAQREGGSEFALRAGGETVRVQLPLIGQYNVENAAGAVAAALVCGIPLREAAARLATVPQVPGRLERVTADPCPVFIDFAHTPDALDRAIGALRPLVGGRLIVVFGAGGDRDPGKRPEMGRVVGRLADLAIVTSDNPRTEDPDKIIDDILQGMAGAAFERITERRVAIRRALELARRGDLVLLAGKGHECYQIVRDGKLPFDEREIVQALLPASKRKNHGAVPVE